ncbi:MAG: hypothetical protein WC858_03545 [Parcubacteria group bacterium]|jgi:hypothetical protein
MLMLGEIIQTVDAFMRNSVKNEGSCDSSLSLCKTNEHRIVGLNWNKGVDQRKLLSSLLKEEEYSMIFLDHSDLIQEEILALMAKRAKRVYTSSEKREEICGINADPYTTMLIEDNLPEADVVCMAIPYSFSSEYHKWSEIIAGVLIAAGKIVFVFAHPMNPGIIMMTGKFPNKFVAYVPSQRVDRLNGWLKDFGK